MRLSPKSFRFVSSAVEAMGDPTAQRAWDAFVASGESNLDYTALTVAFHAATKMEERWTEQLRHLDPESDEHADIVNDIMLMSAIAADLHDELWQQVPVQKAG